MYDCRFAVEQILEANASLTLSAEIYPLPDFTTIAGSIAASADILTAFGMINAY